MTDEQQAVIDRLTGLLDASQPEIGNDELRLCAGERDAIAYALKLVKRERLVQEVVRHIKGLDEWFKRSVPHPPGIWAQEHELQKAARKLAEWKP